MSLLGKYKVIHILTAGIIILELVNIVYTEVITVELTFLICVLVPFHTTFCLIKRWLLKILKHDLKVLQIIIMTLTEKEKKWKIYKN